MAVTFSIKQVPDELAEKLRQRAAANRRSLQSELLQIIEDAAHEPLREPASAYDVKPVGPVRRRAGEALDERQLSLEELWTRARRLGAPMPSESAAIVRHDRDARHRR